MSLLQVINSTSGPIERMTAGGNEPNIPLYDTMAERMHVWDMVQYCMPDLKMVQGDRPEYTGLKTSDNRCYFKKTVDRLFIGYVSTTKSSSITISGT